MERLHVPVLIQFVEAVRLQGEAPNAPRTNLRLEISSPSTNLPGYYQSLQRTWVIPVSETGLLQLELLPSRYLNSPRHYRVRLFRSGNTQPEAVQIWDVPAVYKYQHLDLVRSNQTYDELPPEVFAGVEVPGYSGWRLQQLGILWGDPGTAPPLGTSYSLKYLLPLSLADIVKPQ